jgi:Fic family protein
MEEIRVAVVAGIEALDRLHSENRRLAPVHKATQAIRFSCRLFVQFLTIHPYVDGNGHVARYYLIALLARYGLRMSWEIDPRPAGPYAALLSAYRDGDHQALERFIFVNCARI